MIPPEPRRSEDDRTCSSKDEDDDDSSETASHVLAPIGDALSPSGDGGQKHGCGRRCLLWACKACKKKTVAVDRRKAAAMRKRRQLRKVRFHFFFNKLGKKKFFLIFSFDFFLPVIYFFRLRNGNFVLITWGCLYVLVKGNKLSLLRTFSNSIIANIPVIDQSFHHLFLITGEWGVWSVEASNLQQPESKIDESGNPAKRDRVHRIFGRHAAIQRRRPFD